MRGFTHKQVLFYFYLFDGILLMLLIIGKLPFSRRNESLKIPTALLNPNYVSDVSSIIIEAPDGKITLTKGGSYWSGTSDASGGKYVWPADIQTVRNLITSAQSLIQVQVKADDDSAWTALGVDEMQASVLGFYDKNGSVLSKVLFGHKDSLTLKIYFRTWSKNTVYEMDADMENFLTADESFWADPFLYPQCVTGYDRSKADSLLRRGRIQSLSLRGGLPVDFNLTQSFENGSIINFAVYKKDDGYIVIPNVTAGPAVSEEDSRLIDKLNYRYSISAFTLDNLLQSMR